MTPGPTRHPLHGHPDLREVAVPIATVWTSPDAPRDIDEAAVRDLPDPVAWVSVLDADGAPERRLGLHGRTLTQLLLGEPALVVEDRREWVRVVAAWQTSSEDGRGYPGWVRRAHLATPAARTEGASAFVTSARARCRIEDGSSWELSCGTAVWVDSVGQATATVLLPGGRRGEVPLAAVRISDKAEQPTYDSDDLLATARQFLGVRYLWGGTGAWGLDCSGLVHLTLRAHGRLLPRDAFDQASDEDHLEPVPLDQVRPGDLYFFARPGERVYHVGFATRSFRDAGRHWMLHAPEGGGLIEDAPMAQERLPFLVSAARPR